VAGVTSCMMRSSTTDSTTLSTSFIKLDQIVTCANSALDLRQAVTSQRHNETLHIYKHKRRRPNIPHWLQQAAEPSHTHGSLLRNPESLHACESWLAG
jgi:hypothetical protein